MALNDIFPVAVLDPPDPFRLRVQKALTEALEQITPANGFRSDMSDTVEAVPQGRIKRGRVLFGENDPLPMISILEEPIAPESDIIPRGGDAGTNDYILMVQGFVDDNPEHPTDPAHFLLADVKKRLVELKRDEIRDDRVFRFGRKANTVTAVSWDTGVVRPADEVSAVAYFWLRVTFELAEDYLNPFG